MANKTERVEARFQPEIKQLAERAAIVSGISLTDYLAKLVREDAPKTLKSYSEIQLTNQQFDNFLSVCESEGEYEPGLAIKKAAKRLDEDGF